MLYWRWREENANFKTSYSGFYFFILQLHALFNEVPCSEMLLSLLGSNREVPTPGTIVFGNDRAM